MTDYTELKRLAKALIAATDAYMADECNDYLATNWAVADDAYQKATLPETILALIAELETAQYIGRLAYNFDGYKAVLDERDHLKAENAGLHTGYEAYERVNAELKAENEALRDDIEQNQYDANAWRNGEESVWIEVFNSEGDDPFISAITGQITVEQLALIQAEILEYREDYFEKGSGLYVFKCRHYQAHHDNVGMTEPAHWETDFESYSPFPWEEEAAAMGKGEQS